MSLTSRQRVEAALQHQEPDRTPVFEYVILPGMAKILLGRPCAEDFTYWKELVKQRGFEAAVRQLAIDRLDLAELLGHDLLYVLPNPSADGKPVESSDHGGGFSADPVETVRKRNRESKENPKSWPEETFLIYALLREEMARRDIDLPILAPAYSHGIWTDIDLMQVMVLEPEVAKDHFLIQTQQTLPIIKKYLSLGVEQIGIGGDFAGNRPLISPEAYREFIVPEVSWLSQRIHEADAYSVNASDGNLWSVIDDFLFGCEVDGYIEIDFHASMDLKRLKCEYGDQITFYGNLDCGNILSFGSEEDVRKHTLDCIEAGMGSGGHILTASNAITDSVPLKNYLTMINTYRDRFNLKKLNL